MAPIEPVAALTVRILGGCLTTIVDVGATSGVGNAWYRLDPLAALVTPAPNPAECECLNRLVPTGVHERYVPLGLHRVRAGAPPPDRRAYGLFGASAHLSHG